MFSEAFPAQVKGCAWQRARQHPLIYIHLQGLGQPDLLGLGTSLASLGKKPQAYDFKVGILTIGQTSPI